MTMSLLQTFHFTSRVVLKTHPEISQEILTYCKVHGPFRAQADIRRVWKGGPKTYHTICELMKTESAIELSNKPIKEESFLKYITPTIPPALFMSLPDVTSIEVCTEGVYFSTMTQKLRLKHWSHVPLQGLKDHKPSAAQILEQAFYVVDNLPDSGMYLLENRPIRKITPSHINLMMFVGKLQMAVQTLLNKDMQKIGQHKVFHVRDTFIIKSFHLRVGGERISGQHIVKQIQDGHNMWKVTTIPELWDLYNRLDSAVLKERYANCFLMNLAFFQHLSIENKNNESQ